MFVLTAKISKPKLIAIGILLLVAIILLVMLASSDKSTPSNAPIGAANDDRVAYLATYGWSVSTTPTESQKVRIPDGTDNRIFARYNDLQISQGFDLSAYAGRDVMRYVYEILNYPEANAPVYATVLVADGKIIGGDVTNSAVDGVIHGFQKPSSVKAEVAPTEQTTVPQESSVPAE
ncbi:MAG: DUF4830 domain-containing protein [Ruminococcaceae bacterium]|nr:DUF4830 domain-containing protein [Oscillospiraceae bacterium]